MTDQQTDRAKTNDGRLIERFLRSIDAHGYGGMANYHCAMSAATDTAAAVELAYGLLWLGSDTVSETPARRGAGWDLLCANHARKALLERLDRAGQARGIEAARALMGGDEG